MESNRLPRFKRAAAVAPIELTEHDRQIIRLVHRHRFLRSHQIIALLGGSSQQLLRRLKLLYHHGFLERPRAQIDYYHQPGSRHIVYGLGNKGGVLLKQELGVAFREVSWGEKNRAVGRMFLEHALLVSDVMVTMELACRERGIRLITEKELALPGKRQPFQWRVNINSRLKLGVIPDHVFALEFPDTSGTSQRAYFFLEADRGTMPVTRRNLSQTSFRRKLLAYEATWTQNLHCTRFGFHRFRVLTVTTSAARVKSLVEACSQLERGHGLFLFADRTILAGDLFAATWQTGRKGERTTLLT
ncbi:MAG: replication-relaxation family protein [Verrucomicrobia bacterium]|nr:replication-relaxation family protein [Verrucomicrobiota bacterium]